MPTPEIVHASRLVWSPTLIGNPMRSILIAVVLALVSCQSAAAQINWVTREECKPSWPTWIHYYGANCAPCSRQAKTFSDPAVIKQSQSWNCVQVKVTDGSSVPRDQYMPPETYHNAPDIAFVDVGWRTTDTARTMAVRLYRSWHRVMPKPVAKAQPLRRLLGVR